MSHRFPRSTPAAPSTFRSTRAVFGTDRRT
jgi:hypothetical protein